MKNNYQIEPATCLGFHVKHDGRTVRDTDRKPLIFTTEEQAKRYIQQQCEEDQNSNEI